MRKVIDLTLNKYANIPVSLRETPTANVPRSAVEVDPARLFHHYYLDTRGYAPPNPDPAQFEHLNLLTPTAEFRCLGDGFGIGTAFRRSTSNQLGQAFCRWLLHDHLKITHFAHMDAVINRPPQPGFGQHRVERTKERGDAPDYLCAENPSTVFLAEAKGRTAPISFGNAEFKRWRKQFDHVIVKDGSGTPRSVKGHIVAARFATQADSARVKSKLLAEDPASPGDRPLLEAPDLASAVIALHYSDIAAKIRQPILSSSLATGVTVPDEIQFPAVVWEFVAPPLQGKRFVGGYFPGRDGVSSLRLENGRTVFLSSDPLRLDVTPGTFFGVEETIFKGICLMARRGDALAAQLQQFPDIPFFDSGGSVLRDGSIIAPIHYFNPLNVVVY